MSYRVARAAYMTGCIAVAACYEHMPRRGPLTAVADSLAPKAAYTHSCRDFPGAFDLPHVHGCGTAETAVMVDRFGQVMQVIHHAAVRKDAVALIYAAQLATLRGAYGPGTPMCAGEDGGPPVGRFWQLPTFHVHLVPGRDSTDVELVYSLGRAKYGSGCTAQTSSTH